jgi:hypothetical protein
MIKILEVPKISVKEIYQDRLAKCNNCLALHDCLTKIQGTAILLSMLRIYPAWSQDLSKSLQFVSYKKIALLISRYNLNSQTRLESADHQALHPLCPLLSDFVSLYCVDSTGNVSLGHSFPRKLNKEHSKH